MSSKDAEAVNGISNRIIVFLESLATIVIHGVFASTWNSYNGTTGVQALQWPSLVIDMSEIVSGINLASKDHLSKGNWNIDLTI